MFSVLLRAFSFTFIILIGIMLRSKKIVGEQAGDAVKKVMLNITLPAVIITNFVPIQYQYGYDITGGIRTGI